MNGVKREAETVANERIMRFGGENLNERSSEKVKECVKFGKKGKNVYSKVTIWKVVDEM